MGCFRLLLAGLVVLSHAGVSIKGYNPGVVAVVSFFLLSGFVMTVLVDRYYASAARVLDFYKDRAARIYPQFLFYLLATVIFIYVYGYSNSFLSGCNPHDLALNSLLLPLGYYQFTGLSDCMPVPQAWSLGLETSFYVIIPMLILVPRLIGLAAIASIVVFLMAYFGRINTDIYGYRLLPGTLFIFLVGYAFARGGIWRRYPWIVWGLVAGLFGFLQMAPDLFARHYSKEVLLGVLIGIPILAVLKDRRFSKTDELLGNLSYGVFLNHFLCIWALQRAGFQFTTAQEWFSFFAASIALASITYWAVELPALRWRHRVRYRSSDDGASTAALAS